MKREGQTALPDTQQGSGGWGDKKVREQTLTQGRAAEPKLRVGKGQLFALGPRSVLPRAGLRVCQLWPWREAKKVKTVDPEGETQESCSHHQGGLGHRWLGSWGPGRSYSHHLGPSTSRCCHQPCLPAGQVPEGATPSTGQKGSVIREAHHPSLPGACPVSAIQALPASDISEDFPGNRHRHSCCTLAQSWLGVIKAGLDPQTLTPSPKPQS